MSKVSKVWQPITKAGSCANAPRDGQGGSDRRSDRLLGWNQHIKSLVCQDLFLEATVNSLISVYKT